MQTRGVLSAVLPFLALFATSAAQTYSVGTDSGPTEKRGFPEGFEFGAATAAYQVEGAWNVAGKSKSIWDVFSHKPGKIKDNSTGDDACKSYEYYERDTAMLRYLGVKLYRMSIAWTRILPLGLSNKINQEGIDHYNAVIDNLLHSGIEPVLTIYHWDIPQNLQNLGGWANPLVVQWITDYARVLFDNFGDRVKIWITFNEPAQIISGYESEDFAPGVKSHGYGDYLAAKHIVLANAHIWHMYDKEYRHKQKGRVGISIATNHYQGLNDTPEDAQAAQDAREFNIGIYAHPIFSPSGGYPPRMVQLVAEKSKQQGYTRSRLSDFTEEEKQFCKGTADFYGMNQYTTQYVTRIGYKPEGDIPSSKDDLGVKNSFLNYPMTESDHVAVIPHGMRGALKWVSETYYCPSILITENGIAQAAMQDHQRIEYMNKYLNNLLDAIYIDKINVTGYMAWSLMDNYEWKEGYGPKFGLFYVDHEDPARKRTARLSAIWYRNLVCTRTLDPDYKPKFETFDF